MTKQARQAAFTQKTHRALGRKFLQVYPNPYGCAPHCTLDKMGLPAGRPPTDPVQDGSNRKWVGVRTDRIRTKITQKLQKADDSRSARQTTVLSYMGISAQELTPGALAKRDSLKIPRTRFYLQQIRAGALIPADEPSARAAAVKFEKVADVLKRREQDARKDFDARYGKDAFAMQREVRDTEESQRKAAAKAAAEAEKTPADPSA